MPYGLPPSATFAGICHCPAGGDVVGAAPYLLSLKGAHKAWIVAIINQANAAQATLTPMQAPSVNGPTVPFDMTALPRCVCLNYAVSDELVAGGGDPYSYQLDAALATKIVVFEIEPALAFFRPTTSTCVTLDVSTSHADNIVVGLLFVESRYNPPLSAIVD